MDLYTVDILVKFSMLTIYRSRDVRLELTRAFEAILGNQNPDGGHCVAKRLYYIRWKKMIYRVDESDLWSTWYRLLALTLISKRYPGEFMDDIHWQFQKTSLLGWHDIEQIERVKKQFYE